MLKPKKNIEKVQTHFIVVCFDFAHKLYANILHPVHAISSI